MNIFQKDGKTILHDQMFRNLAIAQRHVDRTTKEEMKMDVQLRTKGQVEVYDIITTFAVSAPAVGFRNYANMLSKMEITSMIN